MAYTDVWDVTAPLDTQAANQGAADFRATKLDIMQRVASFGAGALAARPTPEATSGTADWTGVMYWSTDTRQVFRWNGASWDDISSDLPFIGGGITKASNSVVVTTNNPVNNTDFNLAATPTNLLGVGSIIEAHGFADSNQTAGAGVMSFQVGTTTGGFANFAVFPLTTSVDFFNVLFEYHGIVTASGFLSGMCTAVYCDNVLGTAATVFQGGNVSLPVLLTDAVSAKMHVITGFTGTLETQWTTVEII